MTSLLSTPGPARGMRYAVRFDLKSVVYTDSLRDALDASYAFAKLYKGAVLHDLVAGQCKHFARVGRQREVIGGEWGIPL